MRAGLRAVLALTIPLAPVGGLACAPRVAADAAAAAPAPPVVGIWKAVVPPPGVMHGEFAGADPVGLAAGVRIRADCSINWIDPDTGRRYCFASGTSLEVFLEAPRAYLARALRGWRRIGDAAG